MTYTFENLIDDVKKEAQALRVHATEEERGRLDVKNLIVDDTTRCIYGLLAHNCNSKRAIELIQKCASRFVADTSIASIRIEGFQRIQKNIREKRISDDGMQKSRIGYGANAGYYSTIEAYILLPEAKNASLISYLRGETETLDL